MSLRTKHVYFHTTPSGTSIALDYPSSFEETFPSGLDLIRYPVLGLPSERIAAFGISRPFFSLRLFHMQFFLSLSLPSEPVLGDSSAASAADEDLHEVVILSWIRCHCPKIFGAP